MKKIFIFLDQHIEEYIMVFLLALMSIIIFAQVIARYVFQNSLSWSEEISRYLFVWLAYIAISYGVKENAHIRVDAAINIVPAFLKKPVRILSDLLFTIFAVMMMYYGKSTVDFIIKSNQTSPALGIPMGLVYLAVPVGCGLAAIRLVQNTVYQITGRKENSV